MNRYSWPRRGGGVGVGGFTTAGVELDVLSTTVLLLAPSGLLVGSNKVLFSITYFSVLSFEL